MATRRDYTATAEAIRTTPMPDASRRRLARRMAAVHASTSTGFDPQQFIYEATRKARTGEAPTIDTDAPSGAMTRALAACDDTAGTPEHVHALQAALDLSLTRWPAHQGTGAPG